MEAVQQGGGGRGGGDGDDDVMDNLLRQNVGKGSGESEGGANVWAANQNPLRKNAVYHKNLSGDEGVCDVRAHVRGEGVGGDDVRGECGESNAVWKGHVGSDDVSVDNVNVKTRNSAHGSADGQDKVCVCVR